jgi:hypothetical protein
MCFTLTWIRLSIGCATHVAKLPGQKLRSQWTHPTLIAWESGPK